MVTDEGFGGRWKSMMHIYMVEEYDTWCKSMIHIYIYTHTHTHTHTHLIYIYISNIHTHTYTHT